MLTNGRKLDNRYILREEIGSGGFGAVYLAEDTRFGGNNRVAIKQITQRDARAARLFQNEADLLYNLDHPNLPKVSNCFQENDANFIVMDYISGADLWEKLKKGKRFQIGEVVTIADTVLDALEYLHSFQIYHRDIKPHNIKIDDEGKIYLLDFGTAKGDFDDKTISTTEQSVTGYTPFYAPLEQILRVDVNSYLLLQSTDSPELDKFTDKRTDARSDVYSLGATVYHLLTNRSLEKATATIRAHLVWSGKADPLPDCRSLNAEISEPLARIIVKCLAINPDERFQTATQLRAAFRNLQFTDDDSRLTTLKIEPAAETQPSPAQHNQVEPEKTLPSLKLSDKAKYQPPNSFETIVKSDVSPQSKSKTGAIIGAALVLLAALASVGGWLALRDSSPAVPPLPAQNQPAAIVPPPAAPQTLSYSLIVQKMRDGKKYQEPFESSGQEIFENGYQFKIRINAPAEGYLYVFNEGLNDKNETVYAAIFPTPNVNGGKAAVVGGKQYESFWNQFGGSAGTENFWIIWTKEKSDVLEQANQNALKNAKLEVTDAKLKNDLKTYLDANKNKDAKIVKDAASKSSKIEFNGDALIYSIGLEHR